MKPEEFASSPALSGVLTEKECLAIYQNICKPSSLSMPRHLSSYRKQRRAISSAAYFSPEIMSSGGSTIDKNEFFYCIRKIKNEFFLQKRGRGYLVAEFTANQIINIKGIILTEIITEKYVMIFIAILMYTVITIVIYGPFFIFYKSGFSK